MESVQNFDFLVGRYRHEMATDKERIYLFGGGTAASVNNFEKVKVGLKKYFFNFRYLETHNILEL